MEKCICMYESKGTPSNAQKDLQDYLQYHLSTIPVKQACRQHTFTLVYEIILPLHSGMEVNSSVSWHVMVLEPFSLNPLLQDTFKTSP